MHAPTRMSVRMTVLLGLALGCSFPDPTFSDDVGGAGAIGGSAGSPAGGGAAGAAGSCAGDCEPRLVADGQGEVIAIAANVNRVYWVTKLEAENSSELRSATVTGTDVSVITSEGLGWSAGILAVDQSSAFIANRSSGGLLLSVQLRDGAMPWSFMQEQIEALFLDATTIYYSAPYGLVRLPKVGPSSGGRVDLSGPGPRLLMVEDGHLIVLDQAEQGLPPRRVVRLRDDGSESLAEAAVLVSDAPDFDSASADANAYYFADPDRGRIVRLPRGNAGSLEPLAGDEAIPRKLLHQGGNLYWTTDSGSELRRMPASGAAPVTLDEAVPTVLCATTSGVFWATPAGEIRRLEP